MPTCIYICRFGTWVESGSHIDSITVAVVMILTNSQINIGQITFFFIFQPFSCMINLHFFILVQPFTCLNLLWLLLGFICSLPNLLETKRLCFFVSSLPLFCYFSWNLLLEHLLLEHAGELHIMILKREKRSKKDQVQGAKHPKKEENQKNQKTNSAWTQLSWHSISELKT